MILPRALFEGKVMNSSQKLFFCLNIKNSINCLYSQKDNKNQKFNC